MGGGEENFGKPDLTGRGKSFNEDFSGYISFDSIYLMFHLEVPIVAKIHQCGEIKILKCNASTPNFPLCEHLTIASITSHFYRNIVKQEIDYCSQ